MQVRKVKPEELLPRSVAVLGELGPCVIHNPDSGEFGALPGGGVLCSNSTGDQMFVLRPVADAGPVKHHPRQALHAANLHSRFTHKRADAFFNCIVPKFRQPRHVGELVIVRYEVAKHLDGDHRLTQWEHYFEQPGAAPAYAQLYSVGHGQYWIPPGPWRVTARGIAYAAPRSSWGALLTNHAS